MDFEFKMIVGGIIFFMMGLIVTFCLRIHYENGRRQFFVSKCETPFYFVDAERAADGLIRVNCLSEQGEKKEILIKEK